jgi:6-phosphogluconate dehydrogenase
MNHIAIIGLGTMGANLARNAARNGATVSVFNRTVEKTDAFMKEYAHEGNFIACHTLEELFASMEAPRAILLMVKAGDAVDEVIEELLPHLEQGDMLIDGGNSFYRDTERREKALTTKGFHFIGMGVSGGEEGALHGPSMMPGGSKEAVDMLMPLLEKMAADDGNGGKCVTYIGPGGAGHFVKMVHNGIEYALMQILAETYDVLKYQAAFSNVDLAHVFDQWNGDTYLRSFLMEITARIFVKKIDNASWMIDSIADKAGQKGTGKWTTESAMNYGVAIPSINAAVDARIISGSPWRSASQSLPSEEIRSSLKKEEWLTAAKCAVTLSFISSYEQGFSLIHAASKEEHWNCNMSEIARIWRGGCIIRSSLLPLWQKMYGSDADSAAMAMAEMLSLYKNDKQHQWRIFVTEALKSGTPVPVISASLTFYDALRRPHLPQNLIQAQRDFFGAHGVQLADEKELRHIDWNVS